MLLIFVCKYKIHQFFPAPCTTVMIIIIIMFIIHIDNCVLWHQIHGVWKICPMFFFFIMTCSDDKKILLGIWRQKFNISR